MEDLIWTSVGNMSRIGVEADALIDALRSTFGEIRPPLDLDAIDDDTYWSQGEWAITAYYFAHPFVRASKGRQGRVVFNLSMWRPEDETPETWNGSRQAKLYVAFQPSARAGWNFDNLWVGGDGYGPAALPLSAFRWAGRGNATLQASWFFCVRLTGLETREDIVREVVRPLSRLLEGRDDETAFEGCQATLRPPAPPAE